MADLDYFSVDLDQDQDEHTANFAPEHNVWAAAVLTYVDDIRAHHKWLVWPSAPQAGDYGEAWRDFKDPDCPMLHRMCAHIGYDADVLRNGLRDMLSRTTWTSNVGGAAMSRVGGAV